MYKYRECRGVLKDNMKRENEIKRFNLFPGDGSFKPF